MRTRTKMIAWAGSAFALVAAFVWATGLTTAVVAEEQTLADPLIASATVSADRTTLTVSGLNFAPDGVAPSVSLALTPLPVTASSATAVTAALPAPLEAGTYLLLVTRSDQQAAAFHVTVEAAVAVRQDLFVASHQTPAADQRFATSARADGTAKAATDVPSSSSSIARDHAGASNIHLGQ